MLGALEIDVDGEPVTIDSPKERAVLEVLALHTPDVVSADALIAALWGEEPPASAPKTLQSHVSRLRAELPDGAIVTESAGYRLGCGRDAVDVHRFEDLARAGRQAHEGGDHQWAIELLDDARSLWRGAPLVDVADTPRSLGQRTRLDELRAAVVEDRVDAHLAAGLHREMVAELEALVAERPLDEGLWERLVLALYRCGRRADALAAVGRIRTQLREQLGIDPSPALADLELRVLDDDPDLAAVPESRSVAIPVPITAFVGRTRQLREVTKLLAEHRLVSLLGPGGVGKSRLAIEAARLEAPNHADGVWWVDMAEVDSPDGVTTALLSALRAAVPPGVPAERSLTSFLAGREVLLLIDNAERLTEAVGRVVIELLEAAQGVKVLLTSRAPLGLVGETRYVVPPMDSDDEGDDLVGSEAWRLFIDRWAERGAAPPLQDHDSVEEMCDLVDRLPLGIELAAAAAADAGLATALADLRSHHGLIDSTPGAPTATPGVHDRGGLVTVLASTVRMLTDGQRDLLSRLTVLRGSFDREAAGAVAGRPSWDADLQRLRDLALVSTLESTTGRRLRLLDTTAAYGREMASEETLGDAARRHAEHFRDLAVAAGSSMDGPDEQRAVDRAEADRRNHDAAIQWFLQHRPTEVLGFARALGRVWYLHDHMGSAAERLDRMLSAATAAGDPDVVEHGWALLRLGWPRFLSGDPGGAVAAMEEAEALLGPAGDELGLSQSLKGQGHMILLSTADADRALGLYRRSLDHARRSGEPVATGWVLVEAAQALILADRTDDEVLRMLEEAETILTGAGDHFGLSHLWMDRMLAAFAVHDLDAGREACERGLDEQRRCGNRMYEQVFHAGLGSRAVYLGDLATAGDELTTAVTMAHEDQNLVQLGIALQAMAVLAAARADHRRAARLWGAAGTLAPYWPLFDRRYRPLLAPAKDDLGTAWDAELAAGAALSPDDAVALALTET